MRRCLGSALAALAVLATVIVGIAPPAVADPPPGVGQYFPARHRIASDVEIAAGGTATITVAGVGSLPWTGIGAVALNVAAKGNSATGGLIVYPSDGAQPTAITLRYRTGLYLANMVMAKVGADGKIKVANTGSAAVKMNLDVLGYTPGGIGASSGSTYVPLNPAQILSDYSLGGFANYNLSPLGQGGVPASGVEAVVVNVRATSTGSGALRVHAAGEVLPLDATLDYASGVTSQNLAVVKLGTDGKINFHNQGLASVRLWTDVVGYFTKDDPDGSTFRGIQPASLATNVSIPAGSTHAITPSGQAGHPTAGVEAVSLSIDAQSTVAGTIRVYPAGVSDPGNETVGFNAGIASTGSTLAKLGTGGQIVLKNTGTAAVTVSVAAYGYFRKGLTFSEMAAGPGDGQWDTSVRVNSTTPTLSATASSVAADPVTYTFEMADMLSDTPIASGTVVSVPAGSPATWTVPSGIMDNPGAYRFRVQAADGSDSIWSAWRWLFVDAPYVPTDLTIYLNDPTQPILSGSVSRPSGGGVTGRFYLFDGNGQPLGGNVLGEGGVTEGSRLNLQVPAGLITAGQTYQWQMDACVGSACSARTPMQSFTAPTPPPPPATQNIVLDADDITIKAAKTGATACSGEPCALAEETAIKVGGSGDDARVSVVKLDLDSLPAGARATNATITLGPPSCSTTCPSSGANLVMRQPLKAWTANPTGAEAVETGNTEPLAESPLSGANLQIGDLVSAWQETPSFNDGVILQTTGESLPDIEYAKSGVSVTVEYVPASVPGKVANVTALGGDTAALITWAPPADKGAAPTPSDGDTPPVSAVTGYQVQVLDASDQVLQTLTSTDTHLTASSLANGTAYRFKVRAENAYGWGPWSDIQVATPNSIVGGAVQFVDAVKQYLASREAFLEGDLNSLLEVLTSYTQADLFTSILSTQVDQLLQVRETNAEDDAVQISSTFTFPEVFVSYSPTTNKVTVRTTFEGTTVYANDFGLPTEEETTGELHQESDFVFELPGGSGDPMLTTVTTGVVSADQQINAFTPDQIPEPGDDSGLIDTTTPAAKAAPLAANKAVSVSGIATWARNNYKIKHDYVNDCANFVSKAMYYGGKARTVTASTFTKATNINWFKDTQYWQQTWLKDTWSWSSAYHNWHHFHVKKGRLYWEPNYASTTVGDVLYFRYKTWTQVGHLAVMTKKTASKPSGIFYTHHSNGHSVLNKQLSLVVADYPQIGFGWLRW